MRTEVVNRVGRFTYNEHLTITNGSLNFNARCIYMTKIISVFYGSVYKLLVISTVALNVLGSKGLCCLQDIIIMKYRGSCSGPHFCSYKLSVMVPFKVSFPCSKMHWCKVVFSALLYSFSSLYWMIRFFCYFFTDLKILYYILLSKETIVSTGMCFRLAAHMV